jgi:hypothetical protein
MRAGRILGGLALLVGLGALPSAAAAARPGLVRIVSPTEGQLITGGSVRIAVKAGAGVRSFETSLDQVDVSRSFRRSGTARTATIARGSALKTGMNHLFLRTTDSRGITDLDAVSFVLGARSGALLSLQGPHTITSSSPVGIALSPRGTSFSATLNNHRVSDDFVITQHGSRSVRLSASDGLHFGTNRLRVVTFSLNGAYEVGTRIIRVPRTKPLVGAGADLHTYTGGAVRLNGRSSRAARRGGRLAFSWKLISRPPGSSARLTMANSAQPSVHLDRRGTYTARVTVTECVGRRCSSARDDMRLLASAGPPLGQPVETIADSQGAIRVAGILQPGTGGADGSVVVLDQATGARVASFNYRLAAFGDLENRLTDLLTGTTKVVLIDGIAAVPPSLVDRLNSLLGRVGAAPFDRSRITQTGVGWSVAGFTSVPPNVPTGATENLQLKADTSSPQRPGTMNGYLQQNPGNLLYSFVLGDFVPFSTQAASPGPGETVLTVGNVARRAKLPGGATKGYRVTAFDPRTLQTFDDRLYVSPADDQNVADWLNFWMDRSGVRPLILLQTIGAPKPSDPAWAKIAEALDKLGGAGPVFNALDGTANYAFFGQFGAGLGAEASGLLPGEQGRLSGVLSRAQDYQYQPRLATQGGTAADQLFTIAYQAPQPFPHVSAAVNRYITNAVGLFGDDIRAAYYINYTASWPNIVSKLGLVPFKDGHGFTRAEFGAAKDQFADEITALQDIKHWLTLAQLPFDPDPHNPAFVQLQAIAGQVYNDIRPPQGPTISDGAQVAGGLLKFAAAGLPEAAPALNFLSSIVVFGGNYASSTGSPILSKITAYSNDLGRQLQDRYAQARLAFSQLGHIIVSDYGKLTAVGGSVLHGVQGKINSDPNWIWPDPDTRIRTALFKSAKAWYYQRLMPLVWSQWATPGVSNAREWMCTARWSKYYPWRDAGNAGQYTEVYNIRPGGAQQSFVRAFGIPDAWKSHDGKVSPNAKPPSESWLAPLFQPPDLDARSPNLGLNKPQFFRNFGRTGVQVTGKGC